MTVKEEIKKKGALKRIHEEIKANPKGTIAPMLVGLGISGLVGYMGDNIMREGIKKPTIPFFPQEYIVKPSTGGLETGIPGKRRVVAGIMAGVVGVGTGALFASKISGEGEKGFKYWAIGSGIGALAWILFGVGEYGVRKAERAILNSNLPDSIKKLLTFKDTRKVMAKESESAYQAPARKAYDKAKKESRDRMQNIPVVGPHVLRPVYDQITNIKETLFPPPKKQVLGTGTDWDTKVRDDKAKGAFKTWFVYNYAYLCTSPAGETKAVIRTPQGGWLGYRDLVAGDKSGAQRAFRNLWVNRPDVLNAWEKAKAGKTNYYYKVKVRTYVPKDTPPPEEMNVTPPYTMVQGLRCLGRC